VSFLLRLDYVGYLGGQRLFSCVYQLRYVLCIYVVWIRTCQINILISVISLRQHSAYLYFYLGCCLSAALALLWPITRVSLLHLLLLLQRERQWVGRVKFEPVVHAKYRYHILARRAYLRLNRLVIIVVIRIRLHIKSLDLLEGGWNFLGWISINWIAKITYTAHFRDNRCCVHISELAKRP
jgi:hypothetical protein